MTNSAFKQIVFLFLSLGFSASIASGQSQCKTDTSTQEGVKASKKPGGGTSFDLTTWKDITWKKTTLRVQFLNGTADEREKVRRYALDWARKTNINLMFHANFKSDIRITFDKTKGSYSKLGNNAKKAKGQHTMNFAWLDKRNVLHEFGHALGFKHEHLRPDLNIKWNKPKVYADMLDLNCWGKQQTDRNIFTPLNFRGMLVSKPDIKSIMTYPIPRDWTLNNFEIPEISELSDIDVEFTNRVYSNAYKDKTTCTNFGNPIYFNEFDYKSEQTDNWKHHCNPAFNFKGIATNIGGQRIWMQYDINNGDQGSIEEHSWVEVKRSVRPGSGLEVILHPNGEKTKSSGKVLILKNIGNGQDIGLYYLKAMLTYKDSLSKTAA